MAEGTQARLATNVLSVKVHQENQHCGMQKWARSQEA